METMKPNNGTRTHWLSGGAAVVLLACCAPAATLPIVNGDFELDGSDNAAPPGGWSDLSNAASFWTGVPGETGNPSAGEAGNAPGGLGSYFLTTARQSAGAGSQPTDGELAQVVDLSAFGTESDAGTAEVTVEFIYASDDDRDAGTFSLHFFSSTDGSGAELGSGFSVDLDAGSGFNFSGWQEIPQIFVPYKEVLSIYESGLVNVPDDVTLVWPDDNHGFIRRLSNGAEQLRSGGGGVYYHLSYWGAPADYLWLATTPPALVWEEMTKAYENQCGRLWVFNIGDIKPAEITMEFALRLAWDVDAYGPDCQLAWLTEWATREFGANEAGAIASLLNDYFQLNHRRRPEHMDWKDDDPGSSTPPNGGDYPLFSHVHEGDEVARRLEAFEELRQRADAIHAALPVAKQDAFYQLAVYPVRGTEAMTRKFLHTSLAHRGVAQNRKTVAAHSTEATNAYNEIGNETDHYNQSIAAGKWNEMMDWKPRGLGVFHLPAQPADPGAQGMGMGVAVEGRLEPVFTGTPDISGPVVELHAVDDAALTAPMQETTLDGRRCAWTPGSGGNAAAGAGGRAQYSFTIPEAGSYALQFEVRTPTPNDDSWWIELDGATPEEWNNLGVGDPAGWRWVTWNTFSLSAGGHTLVVHEREDGAAFAAIRIVEPGAPGGAMGEDDRFVGFRLPEFNTITRRSHFIDLINTEASMLAWSSTIDDSWVNLSETSGTLDDEQRLIVSIDWDQLPAGENLQSTIHIHQDTETIDVPVMVWNPGPPPAADFIEENGAVVIEAEHFTSSTPGADATWVPLPGMGRGDGVMVVSPTTAPSLTTATEIVGNSPVLEYSFHLRTVGSHRVEVDFLPALALNNERGRRYAVAVDGEAPTIVALSSQSGSGTTWSRSVLECAISGNSTHAIATPGVHTLKVWMVDPGLVLDRIVIATGKVPHSFDGPRETATAMSATLRIQAGETFLLDGDTASFRRVVNHGTLQLRASSLATLGDLVNFGTLRVIGPSALSSGGNIANLGLLDAMAWPSPGLTDYSNFGDVMLGDLFHTEDAWIDEGGFHIRVPGYTGHDYTLFRSSTLSADDWQQAGSSRAGTGTVGAPDAVEFTWPADQARMFFRVGLD